MVVICVFHYHLFVAGDILYILISLVLETRLVQSLFVHQLLFHHRVLSSTFPLVPQFVCAKSMVQENVQQAQQMHLMGEGRRFTHELGQSSTM